MRRPQRWIALREHPLPRRTPRARLPDCEALDAAQVFGFAMNTRWGALWRLDVRVEARQAKKQLGP